MIHNDLESIINHYGVRKQIKKLSEEVFELQEAVIDCEWDIDGRTDHVAEELADVMVLLEQIRLYYGISLHNVRDIMEVKTDRQIMKITHETVTKK